MGKALDQILKGTGLTYSIDKQFVTIKKVPFASASTPKSEAFIMEGHVYDESGLDVPGVTAMIMGTDAERLRRLRLHHHALYEWKNGYLYFDDEPLTTIAKSLERWYRVPFVFDNPALAQKHLRFFCLRSESIDRAVELLNHFGGFEAKRGGDAVHIR